MLGEMDCSPLQPTANLSIIIPVYNELRTIGPLLVEVARAVSRVSKQIIIVDDCSNDGTSEWLARNLTYGKSVWRGVSLDSSGDLQLSEDGQEDKASFSFVKLSHEQNRGKGAAVRTGLG